MIGQHVMIYGSCTLTQWTTGLFAPASQRGSWRFGVTTLALAALRSRLLDGMVRSASHAEGSSSGHASGLTCVACR